MHKIELSENGRVATLMVDSTAPVKFHAIWLRDNAWDGETRAPGNGQRLIALRDIPSDIHIDQAEIEDQTRTLTFQPEDKTVEYDIDWLVTHSYDGAEKHASGWTAPYI